MFVRQCRYLEDYGDHIFVVKSKVTNIKTNEQNCLFTRQSLYGSGDGVRVKDKRPGRAVVLLDRQLSYRSGDGVRVKDKRHGIDVVIDIITYTHTIRACAKGNK